MVKIKLMCPFCDYVFEVPLVLGCDTWICPNCWEKIIDDNTFIKSRK